MKQKRAITYLLLCISILMLMVPVLPHHHHADGHLCLKADRVVACCHHHTPDDGTPHHCCDDTCCPAAHFVQRTPQDNHIDFTPYYPWATLIYERIALHLGLTDESTSAPHPSYYKEILHGICPGRCQGLRAPPFVSC